MKTRTLSCIMAIVILLPNASRGQNGKSDPLETQGNGATEALSIAERADREIFFETRIRPLLATECLGCHNEMKSRGGLNLTSIASILKGGDSGPALIPGQAAKSLITKAVGRKTDDIAPMPPKKSLSKEQTADLNRWIDDGAIWPESLQKINTNTTPSQTEEIHWSFQPVKNPPIPGDQSNWSRTPVDHFIAAGWNNLKPAPDATRETLVRRLYYDLTGLPPDFTSHDKTADKPEISYEKLVDQLLDSPRFGERWARHWMDIVHYADTAGDNADYPVPEASFYRDYLIDSFNHDKPFDQLVREQISGDLLANDLIKNNKTLAPDEKAQFRNHNIATTYIGLSRRYATGPFELMHLTIEDTITTTSQAFLGLNFRCARCHDHKYDPVTMHDYYALYGIFSSTVYPFAGSEEFQSKRLPRTGFISLLPPEETRAIIDEENRRLQEIKSRTTNFMGPFTLEMIKKQSSERTTIERNRRLGNLPETLETAYGVTDGQIHDEPLQRKGEPSQPGDPVPRAVPAFLAGSNPPEIPPNESGRRQLAQWLASPENPLTARVYVNRVWQHLFGRGLVETPNDFGLRGARPTHPQLLDYLAFHFIKNGWSTKWLVRTIVNSRVYQLSSLDYQHQSKIDPDNRQLWRHTRRRMDADSLRDSLLAISGQLQLATPGPQPFPPIETWRWTQHDPFRDRYESRHRTVYLMTQRIQKHPFLALFDGPDTNASTGRRTESSVPLQSLHLANHPFFLDQSKAIAQRLLQDEKSYKSTDHICISLWLMTLGRRPDHVELELATNYLKHASGPSSESLKSSINSLVHSLIMSNAFLYIDGQA